MKKPKLTEEFLWKLYELLETAGAVGEMFVSRPSWDQALRRGWYQLQRSYEKTGRKKTFSQFISYLRGRGYVKIPEGKPISTLQLTEKGKQRALAGKTKAIGWPPRKDGKMVMLMYDIPQSKRHMRNIFRDTLKFLDYEMLQESVWVSDKDVVKETEQAIREYELENCTNLFIIEKVKVQ